MIGPQAAGFSWISDWANGGSLLTANLAVEPPWGQGYFSGLESAYLGLRFQQDAQTYYGWVRLGTPLTGLDIAWLFDYPYSTIPDTPIPAGLGVPDPVHMSQFIASFRATNEVPPRTSAHSGTGQFTLNGDILTYDLELDLTFAPTRAGIFGPASPASGSRCLVANLHGYTVKPPPSPQFNEPFVFGSISYTGAVALTEKQVNELRTGWLYVNFISDGFPQGELRGQIVPADSVQFTAALSGANEIPRNGSARRASATFALVGDSLTYSLAVDTNLAVAFVGIYAPPRCGHPSASPPLVAAMVVPTFWVLIPAGGFPEQPGFAGQLLTQGTLALTDAQAEQMRRGELFVNVLNPQFPRGELRGPILPVDANHDGVPDFVAAYLEACPCVGGWSGHAQYVRRYGEMAGALAASELINPSQFIRLMRAARASDCGK